MSEHAPAAPNDCPIQDAFPFRTQFTFEYLLDYWRAVDPASPFRHIFDARIKPLIDGNHPLLDPDKAQDALKQFPEAIADLMSIAFSPAQSATTIAAARPISDYLPFYVTDSYRAYFGDAMDKVPLEELEGVAYRVLLFIYSCILKEYYDFEVFYDSSMIVSFREPGDGLLKYFSTAIDDRFARVIMVSPPPELGPEEKKLLSENLNDTTLLMKLIPPSHFEIRGFSIVNKTDVTAQEIVSEIKRALLDKDSILKRENYQRLQDLIRSLLRKPRVILSLAAVHHDRVLELSEAPVHCATPDCIYRDSSHHELSFFAGSIFEKAAGQRAPFFVNDLEDYCAGEAHGDADAKLLAKGAKSVLVQSLYLEDRFLGQCVLSAPEPYAFDPLNLMKMNDVFPLFALVIAHALEDFDNEVQTIIQGNFTSIHPAIEWRFRRAAMNLIDHHADEGGGQIEPILFDGVYPLYCTSDIRGSSTQRNAAIQEDLRSHLALVRAIIDSASAHRALPILDEFRFRIDAFLGELAGGLVSGDEIEIMQFLKREIEPSFDDLRGFGADTAAGVDDYYSRLDAESGTLYHRRRDFDESVDLINKSISAHLDRVQPEAQAMFPHYYDKNTTDGVDQNMYIGASLCEDGRFDRMYLRNLRLWQLMTLVAVARLTHELQPRLKVRLETTHLVVVQDMPLTLVFKTDEKKLAVEGAYNIRYEIMKKRIDKAVVKDTGERLTQIGRIAIVYSQASEAAEYRRYIEFLTERGYLEGEVEEFVLDDLQGIKGLRALRVGINLAATEQADNLVEMFRSA
ncbi:MAG: hypothetical protein EPN93_00535 [Spirochaetes bacterium]|nr:MAG: hypothetical protein EPN93_00535 [Spirochaetota bacterium]